jgi:hypothetical protein
MNSTDSLQATVALLRDLCRQLQSLSDDQIAQVLDGHARLEVRVKARKKLQTSKRAQLTHEELLDLAATLRTSQTREEGNSFFGSENWFEGRCKRGLREFSTCQFRKRTRLNKYERASLNPQLAFEFRSAAVQGSSQGHLKDLKPSD